MQFLTGSTLLDTLGLPSSIDTVIVAADAAVLQATLHLENDLRSPLSEAVYTDTWLINPVDKALATFTLKMTAGWAKAGSFYIGQGETPAAAMEDRTLAANAIVNLEKGIITLTVMPTFRFVVARYEAGFPADATDDSLFDATLSPDWLRTAAALKASQIMASNASLENSKGDLIDGMDISKQYASLVTGRVRYFPMARSPLS
jgi:hypothetical protein